MTSSSAPVSGESIDRKKLIRYSLAAFTALFIPLFIILLLSPDSSDDLWFLSLGYSSLREAVDISMHYGNGRFLGNLFAMLFLNNHAAGSLMRAAFIALFAAVIPPLVNSRSKAAYVFICAALFCVPARLMSQVYVWTSGFCNYVPPVLICIICILLYLYFDKIKSAAAKAAVIALIFVLGFCGQLFVEHCTLFSFLIAAAAVFFAFRSGKKRVLSSAWLLSTIAGGVAMILIPTVFPARYELVEKYRTDSFNSLKEFVFLVVRQAANALYKISMFTFLWAVLSLLLFIIYRKYGSRIKNIFIKSFTGIMLVVFPIYSVICRIITDDIYIGYIRNLRLFATSAIFLLYLIACIHVILCISDNLPIHFAFIGSSVFAVAPFLVYKVLQWRCVFVSYIIIAAYITWLIPRICAFYDKIDMQKLISRASAIILTCTAFTTILTFVNINKSAGQLDEYIRCHINAGDTEIEIFELDQQYIESSWWAYSEYYYNDSYYCEFKVIDKTYWYHYREQEGFIND